MPLRNLELSSKDAQVQKSAVVELVQASWAGQSVKVGLRGPSIFRSPQEFGPFSKTGLRKPSRLFKGGYKN